MMNSFRCELFYNNVIHCEHVLVKDDKRINSNRYLLEIRENPAGRDALKSLISFSNRS